MPADELEPVPPADLRVSDADRDASARQLQEAAADGRLGLDELDARLEAAYGAKTFGELARVTRDLAPLRPATAAAHGSQSPVLQLSAVMNDVKREGQWHVPAHIVATAGMGSVKLDFTDAVLESSTIHVEAVANAGSVILLVPAGWRVDLDGVSSAMGTVRNKATAPEPGRPLLRVTGRAVMGDVVVRHPRPTRWLPR